MTLRRKVSAVLGFRPVPVSILTLIVYIAILISVLVTNELPDVPSNTRGLSLSEAWADLHQIAKHPHPYNSHFNHHVHSYILHKLETISSGHSHAAVVSDTTSNGSWVDKAGKAVYFEGTNILAKITGSESPDNGVLFSAHYDSVSTSKGAIDDGIGVVTLIQLFEYFIHHRPKRTAVFNINNGEEDWLNGAHAFLEHPWASLATSFVNLEGAASGGRPMLFRSSSTSLVKTFRPPAVPHPHANVLSSDAFAQGLIRSGTDYSVYTHLPHLQGGGADFAFYQGRSKYHTKYDSIPSLVGQEKAVWSMMGTTFGVAEQLLNQDVSNMIDVNEAQTSGPIPASGDDTKPVYFDLFGIALVVLSLRKLIISNIVAMTAGPAIVIVMLLLVERIVSKRRDTYPRRRKRRGCATFLLGVWKVIGFWVVLAISIAVNILFITQGYMKRNFMIIYSSPYITLTSIFTLTAIVFLFFPLTATSSTPTNQKHILIGHLYVLTFVFLILTTVAATKAGIGGGYVIGIWNALVWFGCVFTLTERAIYSGVEGTAGLRDLDEDMEPTSDAQPSSEEPEISHEVRVERETERDPPPPIEEVTDRTPLLAPKDDSRSPSPTPTKSREDEVKDDGDEDGTIGWWIIQYILMVPAPVILFAHVGVILLTGMNQGIADGSPALIVYGGMSAIAHFLILPLVPFLPQLRRSRLLLVFLVLVYVISTIWAMTVFPFSQSAPLKVFFQQKVVYPTSSILVPGSSKELDAKTNTRLTGVQPYIQSAIVPSMPSSFGKNVDCIDENSTQEGGRKAGLTTCQWDSGRAMVPLPGFSSSSVERPALALPDKNDPTMLQVDAPPYFGAHITRLNDTLFRFLIEPRNSKSCRIYFTDPDATAPSQTVIETTDDQSPLPPPGPLPIVTHFKTYTPSGLPPPNNGAFQDGFSLTDQGIEETGIQQIRLWSRTWGRVFLVDVETSGSINQLLKGKIACEWVEYASGMIGVDGTEDAYTEAAQGSKIPAFEEVLDNLPQWAVVSKYADGLVEAERGFVV